MVGVTGESVHELTGWFKRNSWWAKYGGKAAAWFLIAALAAELVTTIKANSISGLAIAFLGEQEAVARLEIARIKTPRTLSTETQAELISKAKDFQNITFDKGVTPGDPEVYSLMAVISRSLVEGGWHKVNWQSNVSLLTDNEQILMGEVTTDGVWLIIEPDDKDKLFPAAQEIASIIDRAHIDTKANVQTIGPADTKGIIHLVVGKKPMRNQTGQ